MTTARSADGWRRTGWSDLAAGEWEPARADFERALELEETPDAREGLSWAAWWLDDAATVFAAREAAYRGYRAAGELGAAARMATWLAADELDFNGALAVARGWLGRARRLLADVELGPDHGWLAFHEGYLAHLGGDADAVARLAREAADVGRRFDVPDLEMLGLALEGATLVAGGAVDDGMRALDEATATALEGKATVPISAAWACCFLVGACTAVLDVERAAHWCDRIAEFAERYGSRYMLAFCRAEYGTVHLWRGEWGEAESVLGLAIDDFSRSRPAWTPGALATLAELRRRQGRAPEALELLEQAGTARGGRVVRARLALDAGELVRAIDLAERLLRATPAGRPVERAPALELLARAFVARGDLAAARDALAALRAVERACGTPALGAAADAVDAVVVAAAGEHERARTLLEDAVDGFERAGAVYEAARTRIDLAVSLLALDRAETAADEARAARDTLRALGADPDAGRAEQVLRSAGTTRADSPLGGLTRREREVLRQLAQGHTNRRIAEELVISEHTVHRHVTSILRKLDVHSRTAAAAHALRSGLLDDPPTLLSDRGRRPER